MLRSVRFYSSTSAPSSALLRVGFIGLGQMGSHMARNLAKHKSLLSLTVFDTSAQATDTLGKEGIQTAKDLKSLAKNSDILITMLPSNSIVQSVIIQESLPFLKSNALVIDSSTIDPTVSQSIAAECKGKGVEFVDAPVSGGVGGASAGTLTFMLGTEKNSELFARAQPILALMGKNIVGCGERVGSGQIAKICNNLILGISMIGVSEAMNLGVKMGMDAKTLAEIINTSSGRCWSSEIYNPVAGVVKGAPAERDYTGGFGVLLMKKDLGLAVGAAENTRVSLEMGKKALAVYEKLGKDDEYKQKDFSSIYKHLSQSK